MIWDDAAPPPQTRPGPMGWLRAVLRGAALIVVVFGCLLVLMVVRLVERPLHGVNRPWTPWITQGVCITGLAILGLRRDVRGAVMTGTGAVVANHASWLDIFVLNASKRIYFVAKSEVAGWPGIGWLARATGTVFIRRDPREAKAQQAVFEERLGAGHRLLFFPEGTSTDGRRVIAFKTTLFAAFRSGGLPDDMQVQPVTLAYHAPAGEHPAFYGWWGDQSFGAHMLAMLVAPRHGCVDVIYHEPLVVSDYADRKALARAAEAAVRRGFEAALPDLTD
ncbi:lysophospholipid acyltransferase family protein [Jannaschia donghaensis]|uniref:2-acyl-glycerophospho-ethanolamine acyltransferase n=1 Tax=Jannaschia donghaensis TaxID=420998 RepID=A0A0M6YN77_9RHOB|nr:lysophospholipid acyltransferase family protein [Jannaschia donghaensis]CTQ50476.1 2-acyl-glycerophospho-ethanolamine acyltransferase [Jannaschia donghaensis]